MHYLTFEHSEGAEGVTTLEAMASTAAGQHAAVMAEVQQVLDWAWRRFPQSHGPVDDGMDWDHDLQVTVEDGLWHVVTLTLTGSPAFVDALQAALAAPEAPGATGQTGTGRARSRNDF
jgi:hypothetical protein